MDGLDIVRNRFSILPPEVGKCKLNYDDYLIKRILCNSEKPNSVWVIDKEMPIEQLQRHLGHDKIDAILYYAMTKQSNVKDAYRKYIG